MSTRLEQEPIFLMTSLGGQDEEEVVQRAVIYCMIRRRELG